MLERHHEPGRVLAGTTECGCYADSFQAFDNRFINSHSSAS
jgi:hypothetical protein